MLICVIILYRIPEEPTMPDFDGTGPMKRGRVIGRGQGHCRKHDGSCQQQSTEPELLADKEISGQISRT
jgi:hypothetical protein